MTNEEMRLAIAKAKGYELGYSYELYAEVKLGDPVPEVDKHLMYLYTDSEYSDGSPMWIELPNWPTSIADAWELVEEIPFDVSVSKKNNTEWFCGANGFQDWEGYYYLIRASSDTAPRAICAAWLDWKWAK